MKSFIQIPSRYDVRMGEAGMVELICTDHRHSLRLRIAHPTLGVDEIMRLVEEHEGECH